MTVKKIDVSQGILPGGAVNPNGTDLSRYRLFPEEGSVAWVNREAVNTLARDGEGWSCKRCGNA